MLFADGSGVLDVEGEVLLHGPLQQGRGGTGQPAGVTGISQRRVPARREHGGQHPVIAGHGGSYRRSYCG